MATQMTAPKSAARMAATEKRGAKAAPKAAAATKDQGAAGADKPVQVPELRLRRVTIKLVGTSPVIVHAWDEKAKEQIRSTQQRQAKMKRAPKDPVASARACEYRDVSGKECLLALAFKSAIVSASRFVEGLPMTVLRGALFVDGQTTSERGEDLLYLKFKRKSVREDMVRVSNGKPDMRYRPQYEGWSVDLPIVFNESVISIEQIVNLLRVAGFSVGVFEWRPERNGQSGRFDVADTVAVK